MGDGSVQGGCRVRQLLPLGKGDLDRNSAKSLGIAVLCEGSDARGQLQCRSREAGSSPNFVRPSIAGEQKFWGQVCPRWVPSSAAMGIVETANVLRKRKTGWKCSSLGRIDWRKAATVQKSGGEVIPQTLSDLL